MRRVITGLLLAGAVFVAGCSSTDTATPSTTHTTVPPLSATTATTAARTAPNAVPGSDVPVSGPSTSGPVTTGPLVTKSVGTSPTTTTRPDITASSTETPDTAAPVTAPLVTEPADADSADPGTDPPGTDAPDAGSPDAGSDTAASPSTVVPATTTDAAATTTTLATTTPYGVPIGDGIHISYAHVHHDYPASDVFAVGGCGDPVVSPVNGTILEARRVDSWVRSVNNPATRGGKSVAILGDDGVRYYMAHLDSLTDGIEIGVRVGIGQSLGVLGETGDAGACHVHFGISPPCLGAEWSIRRGVIWPWPYLDAWQKGEQLSPLPEIEQWVADHPDACAQAMADPNANDS